MRDVVKDVLLQQRYTSTSCKATSRGRGSQPQPRSYTPGSRSRCPPRKRSRRAARALRAAAIGCLGAVLDASRQSCGWHRWPVQSQLRQSSGSRQCCPGEHGLALLPPQSTSVSSPFSTWSPQPVARTFRHSTARASSDRRRLPGNRQDGSQASAISHPRRGPAASQNLPPTRAEPGPA